MYCDPVEQHSRDDRETGRGDSGYCDAIVSQLLPSPYECFIGRIDWIFVYHSQAAGFSFCPHLGSRIIARKYGYASEQKYICEARQNKTANDETPVRAYKVK